MDFATLAEEWDVSPDALRAYAKEFADDFTRDDFDDAYAGEAHDGTDSALKDWYFETYVDDDFLESARQHCVIVTSSDVDLVAVSQDFVNVDGYVFRTF